MTTTDWIVDLALIALVLRQLKESRIDRRFFVLPVAIVGWSAASYLKAIPTAGHDLWLLAAAISAGAVLGAASGLATRVRVAGRDAFVQAGAAAAGLWILGTGTRLAFQLYASHGGGVSVAAFSRAHQITTTSAWLDALLLMALTEVAVRLSVIGLRAYRGLHAAAEGTAAARLVPAVAGR